MTEAKVVGVTFRTENCKFDRQEIISRMSGKETVYLKREPKNKFDSNAVAVMVKRKKGDLKIGYIRKELAAFISELWPKYKFVSTILEIRKGDLNRGVSYGISIDIKKIFKPEFKKKREV